MAQIICKECKTTCENYAKGYCVKCYAKIYMRAFVKRKKKTTISVDKSVLEALSKNRVDKDEPLNSVLKRLLLK